MILLCKKFFRIRFSDANRGDFIRIFSLASGGIFSIRYNRPAYATRPSSFSPFINRSIREIPLTRFSTDVA